MHTNKTIPLIVCLAWAALMPVAGVAAEVGHPADFTGTGFGIAALLTFILAYLLVVSEEFLHLRKSKPVMVAAGIIWMLVGIAYAKHGDRHTADIALRSNLLEYAELFLFLLAAMTYINVMEERGIFNRLRAWLVSRGFSLRTVFWITGILAFFISSVADNLTTALLMMAVVTAVAAGNRPFVVVSAINLVVAANAGGAFSPFGDITTLMVWQKGVVSFYQFFDLFIPSFINWLVPAFFMSFAVPKEKPKAVEEQVRVEQGGFLVVGLFLFTIVMAVSFHQFLNLPPVLGMMTGLGLLKFVGYWLQMRDRQKDIDVSSFGAAGIRNQNGNGKASFDIFAILARAEWDTLMFFYGVVLCVGGLGALGYLALASNSMYAGLGATSANILVGVLSSVIDNIPVMYAVLTMHPDMPIAQWLLVTLTAGVGGSLLSVGSAAGVALMGQARGVYTFFSHLKWTWAIALGYAASIWVHLMINAKPI